MIDFKGIHETYQVRGAGSVPMRVARPADTGDAGASAEAMGVDSIRISPEAALRASAQSAASAYAQKSALSSERLAALKEQYQGDRCPVSGQDVARALMGRVLDAHGLYT